MIEFSDLIDIYALSSPLRILLVLIAPVHPNPKTEILSSGLIRSKEFSYALSAIFIDSFSLT